MEEGGNHGSSNDLLVLSLSLCVPFAEALSTEKEKAAAQQGI
jgi:hypothetical protein